ncbi:MAG TPA: polysaccharide biosynthesis tyrosine autokinase [Candidatus Cloacimonadota bacterium]|nr:polysaccharide biosynthesis tyrosine autokinase [Candidatus Cloacimonadota bacterium]HPT71782.1 polysaccharide biosynthesis tyrosine autokinase [Candidatus Cloacimonadota bacterium]
MEQTNLDQNPSDIKITDYLRIILQYRLLVIGIFILVFAGTVVYTARLPKIYESSAKVLLQDKTDNNQMLFLQFPGIGPSTINNNMEIMKSRPVVALAYQIMLKNKDADSFPITKAPNPVSALKSLFRIESKRDTDILTISYESTDPVETMVAANALAEALEQQNTQYARLEFTNIREFLESQLDAISRRLQTSEEDLRTYKIENGLTELSEETNSLITKSADVQALYEAAQTDLSVAKKTLSFLSSQLTEQDSMLTDVNSIISTPYVEELRQNIVDNQALVTKLITKNNYPTDHPQIVQLNNELVNAKNKLQTEISKILDKKLSQDPLAFRAELVEKISTAQVDLMVAQAKVDGLKSTVEGYNQRIMILPDKELELARLTRNMMLDEKIHDMMVEKYEDAKVAEQAKMGNIRIIERAVVPQSPIKPRPSVNFLVGIMLGLGLGIGAAFLVHSLDTRIRTLDDIETFVKLPILGTIPMIQESESDLEEFNQMIEKADGESKAELARSLQYVMAQLVSHYAPKSPIAESYRTLRTNIISKKPPRSVTVLVTSSGPKEGKSTSIANMAVTLAQMNAKVILVDLDLRRPMIQNKFMLDKENGVSDYLIDSNLTVAQVAKHTEIPNLDIITSGFIPPNPSEMLSSKRFDELILDLKENYDFILFDSPPVIAVTDALILAKKVDMLLLIVRIGLTEKGIVKRARELLANVNAKIDGIVVNGIQVNRYYSKQNNYYYYYYYYYGEDVPKKDRKFFAKLLRKDKSLS